MLADVPIFPLSSVLFPGGVLPLRIFEARYMDMVRDCMRQDTPFGVCLITRGGEVGEPAEHEHLSSQRHHGLTFLLLPLNSPGVTVRPIRRVAPPMVNVPLPSAVL